MRKTFLTLVALLMLVLTFTAHAGPPAGYPSTLDMAYDMGDGSGYQTTTLVWSDEEGGWEDGLGTNLIFGTASCTLQYGGGPIGDTGFTDDVVYVKVGTDLVCSWPNGIKRDWPYDATFYPISLTP